MPQIAISRCSFGAAAVAVLLCWTTVAGGQRSAPPPDAAAAAARSRIAALAGTGHINEALSAYDQYVATSGRSDAAVLAGVGRAMLKSSAADHHGAPMLAVPPLERLARAGDQTALEELKGLAKGSAGTSSSALAPLIALSRLGDTSAEAQLAGLLDAAPEDQKAALIHTLQDANARDQAPRIAAYLTDAQPAVRSTAAFAVGVLGYSKAIPALEQMLKGEIPIVRMFAAAGLKRLGQSTADNYLASLLQSDVPEMRLVAASAYENSTGGAWLIPVKRLLSDPNPVTRIRAAAITACCDRTAARAALLEAFASANPSLRDEAAAVLEEKGLIDAPLARRLLGDPIESVRIHGAGGALDGAAHR